jgi:thymidylate kinase
MLIIDGLDKTGKTTLQQGLVKRFPSMKPYRLERCDVSNNSFDEFDTSYWHAFSIAQKNEMLAITKILETGSKLDIVIDRFIATEYAYLEVGEVKELDYIWELDEKLAGVVYPPVYIWLAASVDWIADKLSIEEANLMDNDRMWRYHARFMEFFERSKMQKIRVDVPVLDERALLRYVSEWIIEIHNMNWEVGYQK